MIFGRNDFFKFLVNLVYFFVLFNAVFVSIGVKYIYLLFFAFFILILAFGKLKVDKLRSFLPSFIYILSIFMSLSITMLFLDGELNSFISYGLYTLPVLFWTLFYSNPIELKFKEVFCSSLYLTVFVAALGIYQYFFSPSLHGFIPLTSLAFNWAEGKAFSEYSTFFRATSTLGSPQVFGLFCALNLILMLRFKPLISPKLFYIGCILLALGGALSGNKSFYFILAIFLFLKYRRKVFYSFKVSFLLLGIVAFSAINVDYFLEKIPMLERIASIDSIVAQEQTKDGRLSRYIYILQSTNPLLGEGLGKITNRSNLELRAAESYFLKIYYEAGLFALVMILYICFSCFRAANRGDKQDGHVILLIVLGMVVVHAFESPAFFLIWGYMFSILVNSKASEDGGVHGCKKI